MLNDAKGAIKQGEECDWDCAIFFCESSTNLIMSVMLEEYSLKCHE